MDQENILSCMWWHAPRISAQGLLEQEDCAFEDNLNYVEGTYHKKTAQKCFKHITRCVVLILPEIALISRN